MVGGAGILGTLRAKKDEKRWQRTLLPLALVVVSLAYLAIFPWVSQRKIVSRQREIQETLEPAREALREVQASLGLEAAGARGFLLSGNLMFKASYLEAKSQRDEAIEELEAPATALGAEVLQDVDELREELLESDRVLESFFEGALSRRALLAQLPEQQERFERAIQRTRVLAEKFAERMATLREQNLQTVRRSTVLVSVFGLLALVAVVQVASLGNRYRRLAIEIERITRSRARLVRGFTHDLKNPLGAADGFLQLMERSTSDPLNEKQRARVERVRGSLLVALELIEDLLQLAQLEGGGIKLGKEAVDLLQIVVDVASQYRGQAEGKGLEFWVEIPERVSIIESDPLRISQVIGNLVSNAVKYTAVGRVTMRVVYGHGRKEGEIGVQVEDTGPGIAEEERATLFEEFRRGSTAGGERGAGIGLSISQRLAAILGGEITLESQLGSGSIFTFWLPLGR